jgi:cysteinyl-tRNA synthetase
MFRLYDTRTGRAEEIAVPPGGLLRLFVGGPLGPRHAHAGELRSLLVADLILRNAEHRHGLVVWAALVVPDDARTDPAGGEVRGADEAYGDALSADAAALNLRPAERVTRRSAEPPGSLAELITSGHILIDARSTGPGIRPASGAGPGPAQRWVSSVRAGRVLLEGRELAGPGTDGTPQHAAPQLRVADLAERGLDPLALRLAYQSGRYREQADLTWAALADADRELRRWRERVAEWAESPSRPMCAEVTARVAVAFDDDLDTPRALRALRELDRDPDIPPGSKFESFVHADQLLGLDLPRDIGRSR